MHARLRLRRLVKWPGVTFCGFLLALWIISIRFSISYQFANAADIEVFRGCISYRRYVGRTSDITAITSSFHGANDEGVRWKSGATSSPHNIYDFPGDLWKGARGLLPRIAADWPWPVRFDHALPRGWNVKQRWTVLPIWIPFVVVAAPTAFVVYQDRRRRFRVGRCPRCGYDLTGNLSGQCSECGMPFANEEVLGRTRDGLDQTELRSGE